MEIEMTVRFEFDPPPSADKVSLSWRPTYDPESEPGDYAAEEFVATWFARRIAAAAEESCKLLAEGGATAIGTTTTFRAKIGQRKGLRAELAPVYLDLLADLNDTEGGFQPPLEGSALVKVEAARARQELIEADGLEAVLAADAMEAQLRAEVDAIKAAQWEAEREQRAAIERAQREKRAAIDPLMNRLREVMRLGAAGRAEFDRINQHDPIFRSRLDYLLDHAAKLNAETAEITQQLLALGVELKW